jgi:hypothetical protein
MLNQILHKIAALLGMFAGSFDLDDFISLAKKLLLLSAMLGVVYVLYAVFYLNESLLVLGEKVWHQMMQLVN